MVLQINLYHNKLMKNINVKLLLFQKLIDKYTGCGFIYNEYSNNMSRLEIKCVYDIMKIQ